MKIQLLIISGSFSDYENIDSSVLITDIMTDDDIMSSVVEIDTKDDYEDEDQFNETIKEPTNAEVSEALKLIYTKLITMENTPKDIFDCYYNIQKHMQ